MITRKKIDPKSITLQEILSELHFGHEGLAIFESPKGFGILVADLEEGRYVFISDDGIIILYDKEIEVWLSTWNFVEYKAYKDLDISF